jgi:hypothetical protein
MINATEEASMMFVLLQIALSFSQDKFTADVYDLEGKTKMFNYQNSRTMNGDVETYLAEFKDATTGEAAATEKTETREGVIVRYEVNRVGPKDSGLIEVKDGKIIFSYNDNGKKSESKEPLRENTLISATLCPYLESHFADILAKNDVDFRLAAWYRKETVGFRFSLDKEENGQVVVKMNPTNLLYRSLVKPIYFTYNKANKKLVSIKGRTLPKRKEGSSWKDFDALVLYK